jgi:HEAT repeats
MKKLLVLPLLAGLIAAGVFLPARLLRDAPPTAAKAPEARHPGIGSGKSLRVREETRPIADPVDRGSVEAVIEEAVLTYSPDGVKAIRPFLQDSDPAIRRAARDGLVQLGEADAVPYLREAALRVEDPEEIASLREAADLLALPAWSDSAEAREAVAEILKGQAP